MRAECQINMLQGYLVNTLGYFAPRLVGDTYPRLWCGLRKLHSVIRWLKRPGSGVKFPSCKNSSWSVRLKRSQTAVVVILEAKPSAAPEAAGDGSPRAGQARNELTSELKIHSSRAQKRELFSEFSG